jgi:hypothetical protein
MIKSKLLTDSAWKDVLAKNKAIKDNGLLKTLVDLKKVGDDEHDDALKALDELLKLSGQLKKSKEISSNPAAGKYLADMINAAETSQREVTKARAEAAKAQDAAKAEAEKKAKAEADKKSKADAEAKKREQDDKKGAKDEEESESEEEASALLTTKMIPLLRQVNKGEMMHALVASSGKQVAVMLSRKPIAPARRKLLADELGVSGGIKYIVGHCLKEEGLTTFVLKTQVAGMAKKMKLALLEQTGLRVKLRCRGEDGETDDDLEEEAQEAKHGGARDDHEGDDDEAADKVPDFVPGVDIKKGTPELAKAPEVWEGTRELLEARIASLKKAVRDGIADEGAGYIRNIDANLEKLDRILGRLDKRLTSSLTSAGRSQDAGGRNAALQEAKAILAEYIRYVRSEPLIDHLDSNPFGVKTELKATLTKNLAQLARAIG